jgi:DNA replication protein DnaC
MSTDSPQGPSRLIPTRLPLDPAECQARFREVFGKMPAPTADMDPRSAEDAEERRRQAIATLQGTIPNLYTWARFKDPKLAERVGEAAKWALDNAVWRQPRLIFMGVSRAGKTSLAVACLRRWVRESGRAAGFFHAFQLGTARIQHPAGRGEAELVAQAMKFPLALVDDMGSERDSTGNALPDVIFARNADDLPLWVTTGLTRRQLGVRYGTGIVGRLFERSMVIPVSGRGVGDDDLNDRPPLGCRPR